MLAIRIEISNRLESDVNEKKLRYDDLSSKLIFYEKRCGNYTLQSTQELRDIILRTIRNEKYVIKYLPI